MDAGSEKPTMAPSQPSTLLDFSQATQSFLERGWEPYGSRGDTVGYRLKTYPKLGQVLVKSGRGFHAALRYPSSDAPSLRWPPYRYYEIVVKSSDMDMALHINVATGDEDRTLFYGPAQRYGPNPEEPDKEFQIPLDERVCDGVWHSVIIDLMGDVKSAGWSEFWKVRWLALHGEMMLYRVRGSNDLLTLEKSAIDPVYSVQRQPSGPSELPPVSSAIRKLATLIRARRQAGDQPYTLLLGSSLSLTPEVRQAVCGSDDWVTFWTAMERLSAAERRALLASPLDGLNLTAGYRCLAQLIQASYFDLVFTLNVDDALDESLRILPAREYQIFTHGQVPSTEIAAALGRTHPRVKMVKLHGDLNAYKLPLTPEGQFEFPKKLEEAVERLLSQDTILVGDISHDTDIQRCIRQGEGALWVLVPEEPRLGSFLFNAKKARPRGEIICGPEAEFVSFFSALARELGMEGPKTSMLSPRGRNLIEFTFVPPEPDDYRNWFSAFRRVTEEGRANGDWTDNNGDKHRFRHLEHFVEPFCKGQVYDASFSLYSKDADGNFYEEVVVIVKVKPETELSFEVTDQTQAQRREKLANTIQREIGKLKGVRPTGKVERGLSLADERAFLKQELVQHKRNLYTLREQAAIFAAGETPLHLLNQINAEEEEIRRIEVELERLER
jgi:hypothetical protein